MRHSRFTRMGSLERPQTRANVTKHRHLSTAIVRARRAAFALSAVTLCSCSALYDPYVSMGTGISPSPSYEDAVGEARAKQAAFDEKLGELEKYDFGTGALLFGSGLAGLGLAAFSASSDALIGASLGVGAAAGARTFLPIQDRKLAYASGSAAIDCALTAFSLNVGGLAGSGAGTGVTPQGARTGPTISATQARQARQLTGPLVGAVNQLASINLLTPPPSVFAVAEGTAMQRAGAQTMSLMTVTQALSEQSRKARTQPVIATTAVATSRNAKLQASIRKVDRDQRNLIATFDSAVDSRGPALLAATAAIVHTVNAQLIAARLDPDGALEALQNRSAAFTKGVTEQAAELHNSAGDSSDDGQETTEAALDAEAVAESETNTEAARVAAVAAAMAEDTTNKANEVARLAQQIHEMVQQSAACAFGPGRPPEDNDPSS